MIWYGNKQDYEIYVSSRHNMEGVVVLGSIIYNKKPELVSGCFLPVSAVPSVGKHKRRGPQTKPAEFPKTPGGNPTGFHYCHSKSTLGWGGIIIHSCSILL